MVPPFACVGLAVHPIVETRPRLAVLPAHSGSATSPTRNELLMAATFRS
jgi:hypothetical protein